MGRHLFRFAAVTMLLLAGGCATAPARSNAAADYHGRPERVMVLANMGPHIVPEYAKTFKTGIAPALNTCGIASKVAVPDDLSLAHGGDERMQVVEAAKQFKPDAVLRVFETGYATRRGVPQMIYYQAVLSETATGRAVWRARFDMRPADALFGFRDIGDIFAKAMVTRMARDGVLRACQVT